jgi:hypothetical protein
MVRQGRSLSSAALMRAAGPAVAALLAVAAAVGACKPRDVRRSSVAVAEPVEIATAASPGLATAGASGATTAFGPEPPLGCATLRDVGVSDIVRAEAKIIFYADAAAGLTVVDASQPAHPRVLSVVPFVGTPLALFVREGLAWVVYADPDSRSGRDGLATVVRAVDVRDPRHPRIVGDEVRADTARDAKLVGGLLYLLRADKDGSVVESFGVSGTKLEVLDRAALQGAPAQLAASAAGLAVATTEEADARVAWLDLSMERRGSLLVRRVARLSGGIATWERGEGRIIDADEGQRVRIVTCTTRACTPSDSATLQIVDFGLDSAPRSPSSLRITDHDGLPTTRFAEGVLYVAETPRPGAQSTTLRVVLTDVSVPRFAASLRLRGRITALVPRDGSLVALGSVGSTDAQLELVVHDIDVRQPAAPRARSSLVFGSDWTWSMVADDANAMSFDPSSSLIAVPFTAWRRADTRYVAGVQILDRAAFGGLAPAALPVDGWTERAIFLDGHLVTLGPGGLSSIDYASVRQRDDTAERPLEISR